jgi:hypothetical protein
MMRRAFLDNATMIKRVGKNRDGLHIGFGEQFIEACEKKIGIELIIFRVTRDEVSIRFHNSHKLNIRTGNRTGNKSARMVVNQTDDGKMNRWPIGFVSDAKLYQTDEAKKEEKNFFH